MIIVENSNSIFNSLNDLFSKLFSSIDNNIYSNLDEITFINTDIIKFSNITKIVGDNSKEGILLISNALIFGIIIYYSINYLISHLTMSKIQNPTQFIFKLIIFSILMNFSVWICLQIVDIISTVSLLVRQIGEKLFKESICFSSFIEVINEKIYLNEENIDIFSFDGIIKFFLSVGFINLIFTNSLRYIMVQALIILSPFAFLCLISDKTEMYFKKWLISFLSLLLEQILISVILILSFSFENNLDQTYLKILYIGVLNALSKSNYYMNQIIGGISTTVQSGISNLKKVK